jgi:CDP-glucose 4,6-dehydratase
MGTLNLLEAVRMTPSIKAVVIVTSDKCYENRETIRPYREDDPMGGYDPYSSSKGCAEILTSSYRQSFFNPMEFGRKHNVLVASVRAGNVIGGGDWSENRLIPDFARAFRDGRKVILRSPQSVRPWQHVLEPINGYLLLAEQLLLGNVSRARAYNFGPDPSGFCTVEQIVQIAQRIWKGFEYSIENAGLHEAKLLMLDSSIAQRDLNWRSTLNVEESIEWTLDWYKAFLREKAVLTTKQIEKFFRMEMRMEG